MTNEELVSAIQTGDRARICDLWEQVERFVSMQAGKRARQLNGFGGVTEEDLYQSGFLAMVDAADRFDPAAGKSFIGFLEMRLRTYFADAAGYRGVSRDMLDFAVKLDEPSPGADDLSLSDMVEDIGAAEDFENMEHEIWLDQLRSTIRKALEGIPADQAAMIWSRFYENKTLKSIGEKEGMSAYSVKLRVSNGLRSMRYGKNRNELKQFIELKTPYYTGTGLTAFRNNGSHPERLTILRESLWNDE